MTTASTPLPPEKPIDSLSFEEAMKELESIVLALEGGHVPLEKSIALYERGHLLRQHCERTLHDATLRVEKMVQQGDKAWGLTPLDEPTPHADGVV